MGKCYKVCLCISSFSNTLSRRIIMHYFYNLSSASGGFVLRPTGVPSLDPAGGDFSLHTPNLPTHGKNTACTHDLHHLSCAFWDFIISGTY